MGWAFVKWLRYCKTTSQMQELGRMWSTVTCQLNQNQICYSNSSFLVNCFSRVLSTQFFAILVFLKKSKQKGKIHCRTLSIFNVVILKISNKILPFVSVMHNQLCTGGWQIAAQSTGNGQCSADPHGAACRIPGWSCHTDLTAGSSCGSPLWCVQHSCHPQLWCSTCHVWLSLCLRLLPRSAGLALGSAELCWPCTEPELPAQLLGPCLWSRWTHGPWGVKGSLSLLCWEV